MALSTEAARIVYQGNGSTVAFSFPYYYLEKSHVKVVLFDDEGIETPLSETTHYTITDPSESGGTITMLVAPGVGEQLAIYREVPLTQEFEPVEGGALPAADLERSADKLMMAIQQLADLIGRSPVLSANTDISTLQLPPPIAGNVWAWNDGADAIEFVPLDDALLSHYTAPGTNAVERTVEGKLQETVSVADYETVADAVAYAYANGLPLFWPDGDWETTASISNLHAVKHYGPGRIKRGTDYFYPDPVEGQSNVLYVATSGSATADGLSASQPMDSAQTAVNALALHWPLNGRWSIKLAAGTYSTSGNRTVRIGPANADPETGGVGYLTADGMTMKNWLTIQGPDVGWDPDTDPWPSPTCIFDANGASVVGIQIEGRGLNILVKDIKFIDYDGSSSSAGIANDGGWLRCENVHAEGCEIGILSYMGRVTVKGGDIYGTAGKAGVGIKSMFLNKHEIGEQSAGAAGQGPRLRYLETGLHVQEGSTGHSDYVTYEDCTDGVRVTVNSRANFSGSEFERCTKAVRVDLNSVIYASAADYGSGADACTENVVIQQGGAFSPRDNYANSGLATDYLTSAVTHTGTTASTAILTKTLTKGLFAPNVTSIRKPQHIRFVAYGTLSGTADTKQFKLRVGSTAIATITNAASDAGSWRCEGLICFKDSNVQDGNIQYTHHLTSTRVNSGTAAEDLAAADVDLKFEIQLSNSGDTVVVRHAHFEVWG